MKTKFVWFYQPVNKRKLLQYSTKVRVYQYQYQYQYQYHEYTFFPLFFILLDEKVSPSRWIKPNYGHNK